MAQAPDAGATAFARLCQHWNAAATHGIQGFHGLSLLGSGGFGVFFLSGAALAAHFKGKSCSQDSPVQGYKPRSSTNHASTILYLRHASSDLIDGRRMMTSSPTHSTGVGHEGKANHNCGYYLTATHACVGISVPERRNKACAVRLRPDMELKTVRIRRISILAPRVQVAIS